MDGEQEHATEATGIPAEGVTDVGGLEPLGRSGLHHWKQASIGNPSLADKDSIYFAVLQMTRMPMILADPRQHDCPIVFANNAFLDLTGYEESEVLGRNCRFLQGAGTDPASVQQLRDGIRHQVPVSLEILNYRRDASPFWNAIFMGPVFDQEGELLFFFASQLDVSRRRDSEQSMRQAQKMEAIGQLTAGLAHDFNNLLHIMDGSLERMKERRGDDSTFMRNHAAALAASERGAKLTRQLLAFARRTRLEPRAIDLTDLVSTFSELLETSVGGKAELFMHLRRRLPKVRVDPNHLEMALLNVVVNARDASPNGGSITISTAALHLNGGAAARELEPGDYVVLSVADEGEGMPPHILARATEPFFTTKGTGKGTGLGLAMAQGFVQQSGGRLEIESEPGRGTTVRMIFPELRPDREDGLPQGYQSQAADRATAPLILVVDDDRTIAEMAAEALQETGYRTLVAHDADEAIARVTEANATGNPIGLVFSDVMMPGGANGLVLADWVRQRSPATPVLLTTGYNDEMHVDGPKTNGLEVLGKPYRKSELLDRVQATLARGARSGPGRQTSAFGAAQE